jgi:hypothetical protein
MNKSTLIVSTIAVIVFVGMILFLILHNKILPSKPSGTTSQSALTPIPTGIVMESSFRDLLVLGGNQRCYYPIDNRTSLDIDTGEVFINGNNIQGAFTLNHINFHVVANKDTFYIWSQISNKGYSLPLSAINNVNAVVSAEEVRGFDIAKKKQYVCVVQSVPRAFFIPKSITFIPYKR